PGARLGLDTAQVADVRAAVELGVGVDRLAPATAVRQADPVLLAWDGREVGDGGDGALTVAGHANEGNDVALDVVRVQPAEARGLEVDLVQRRLAPVDAVQVANQALHARVLRAVEQVPVE